jgi:hypothetical protein
MIPADHITIEGEFAWLVYQPGVDPMFRWKQANRPCDWCTGDGYLLGEPDHYERGTAAYVDCDDCHGTGRHVFEIEVEWPVCEPECPVIHPGRTLSVSVVEVLGPIDLVSPGVWTVRANVHVGTKVSPLPSAAAPGMTAVKLKVVR